MAKLTITITDHTVKKELNFLGEVFDYTLTTKRGREKSDKSSFAHQFADRFGKDKRKLIKIVEELDYLNTKNFSDTLKALTKIENEQVKIDTSIE